MENKSIWEKTVQNNLHANKESTSKTDILIIGAGMAGVSAAYYLKDSGRNILLLDKDTVGSGVTAKTTGKLTYLQGTIYQNIKSMYNLDTAKQYLQAQREAIHEVVNIVRENQIECHLKREDSYVFTHTEKGKKQLEKEESCLKELDVPVSFTYHLPNGYPSRYAIVVKDTYTFHPLEYLYGLTKICLDKGIHLEENRCVLSMEPKEEGYLVHTTKGDIEANIVLVCTHYPFFLSPSYIPFKSHTEKSYLLSAPSKDKTHFSAISIDKDQDTMRFYQNNFIFGGQNHKTSTQLDSMDQYISLTSKYKKHFKEEIEYIWSTHDILSEDYMPYIGYANKDKQNLLIATAFHKWGMTNGTLAGKIMADLILTKQSVYKELFAPYRSYTLKRSIGLLGNVLATGKIYTQTKLTKNHSFYPKNVKVYKKDGVYYGSYKDEKGMTHTVYNKCPHMGCSLIFNRADKSWDCPCHGSKFDIDGHVLEGPSSYSIQVKR